MKNQNYFKWTGKIFVLSLLFIFSGCKKNVPGPQGDPGTPGKPGNLLMSHSTIFNVKSDAWTLANKEWETLLFVDGISKEVIDKGEIQLYVEKEEQWWSLPYGKGFAIIKYSAELGVIRLKCVHVHAGTADRPLDANYRVVIFYPA